MLRQKRNGSWVTSLTKRERAKLDEALAVLSDLTDLHPTVEATRECLRSVVRCIAADGNYSEAVTEKANG